jgi:hypothetical protein
MYFVHDHRGQVRQFCSKGYHRHFICVTVNQLKQIYKLCLIFFFFFQNKNFQKYKTVKRAFILRQIRTIFETKKEKATSKKTLTNSAILVVLFDWQVTHLSVVDSSWPSASTTE